MKTFDCNKAIKSIKENAGTNDIGMILVHNGVVRKTSRKGDNEVFGMDLDYDENILNSLIEDTLSYKGVKEVKVWINKGQLEVGDDIMYVIVAGDRKNNILKPFENLVSQIKLQVVKEQENIK